MTEFRGWIAAKIAAGDLPALIEYRMRAVQNYSTDEHLLPLFVALGASNEIDSALPLDRVKTYGLLVI